MRLRRRSIFVPQERGALGRARSGRARRRARVEHRDSTWLRLVDRRSTSASRMRARLAPFGGIDDECRNTRRTFGSVSSGSWSVASSKIARREAREQSAQLEWNHGELDADVGELLGDHPARSFRADDRSDVSSVSRRRGSLLRQAPHVHAPDRRASARLGSRPSARAVGASRPTARAPRGASARCRRESIAISARRTRTSARGAVRVARASMYIEVRALRAASTTTPGAFSSAAEASRGRGSR